VDLVEYLLKEDANANHSTPTGVTPLIGARGHGALKIVQSLIRRGADINAAAKNGRTALIAHAEDPATVQLLLDRGADPNASDDEGVTALMRAVRNQPADCVIGVEALLSHGAKINAKAHDGGTALREAVRSVISGQTEYASGMYGPDEAVVLFLLQRGADVSAPVSEGGWRILMEATKAAHFCPLGVVRALLDNGAYVKAKTSWGWTALMGAAEGSRADILCELLDRGADIDAADSRRWTALTYARNAMFIPRRAVDVLVERGAREGGASGVGNEFQ